jgi:hypothetical protein
MSNRLDQEREARLQPKRMDVARQKIQDLGFDIFFSDEKVLAFKYKDEVVQYFPYSGWHTGKSIKDGRGLQNLLKQINKL